MSAAPGHRAGTVGIVGRPNTGKSSLLNRILGQKLSIVSPRAQTTRHLLTGILSREGCQYVFIDAPGQQLTARSTLQRALNRRATEAGRDADVALFVLEALRFRPEDQAALERIPESQNVIAVVNKIDTVKNKQDLIPFLDRLSRTRAFRAVVPVSARTGKNVEELLRVVREALPDGPAIYPEDQLTDKDERFFASELVREQLFEQMGEELPYRCEVVIDSFKDEGRPENPFRRIEATILVERDSQKAMVIGANGAKLKAIATRARKEMERLFGGKVYLGVWVKVRKAWTDDARVLKQLGYE
ncbi:MAG TPA: GTPase Era [Burkholderiales bacterium]|nr:GTPase Era [Burkholderiales bacterium]